MLNNCLWLPRFQLIEVVGFPIEYNVDFWYIRKKILINRKLKLQKPPTYFGEDHWEENFRKKNKNFSVDCQNEQL